MAKPAKQTDTAKRRHSETFGQYVRRGLLGAAIPPVAAAALGYGMAMMSDDTMTMVGILDMNDKVTPMIGMNATPVAKEFNCRTRIHRCDLDMGSGVTLKFAKFSDYMKTVDFLANGVEKSFKGVAIPDELNKAFVVADVMTPYPYQYWMRTAFAENGFHIDRMNPDTKARGFSQIIPSTALEILYDMRKSGKYPHIPESAMVERYTEIAKDGKKYLRFRVGDGVDEDKLLESVLNNPMKAIFVTAEYNDKYFKNLEQLIGSDLTSLHGYTVHWQGGTGAANLWKTYEKDPDAPAYSMYAAGAKHKAVRFNRHMFFDRKGNARSFENMLNYIAAERGLGKIKFGNIKNWQAPSVGISSSAGTPEIKKPEISASFLPEWRAG
ncbi:MAG: hypothetical protein WC989_00170 [Micavibrio sp.]